MYSVEIIASGSELTSGDRLNTNAQWLSLQLADIGFQPRWHTTVGDELEDNLDALRIALNRADFVVMTGGLGPTQDDLTREVFAEVAGSKLELRPDLLEHINHVFSIRGIDMPARNRVQAFTPVDSIPLTNPMGTAPGIWMVIKGKPAVALPGVPREMTGMWAGQVVPLLIKHFGPQGKALKRKINLYGLGESAVEEKVLDLTKRGHIPEVGITASEGVISLRIVARTSDPKANQQQVDSCAEVIYSRLKDYIFSEGEVTLLDAVVDLCSKNSYGVAIFERGTEGALQKKLEKLKPVTLEGSEDLLKNQATLESAAAWMQSAAGRAIGLYLDFRPLPQSDTTLKGTVVHTFAANIAIATPTQKASQVYGAVGSGPEILSRSVNVVLGLLLKALQGRPF